MSIFAKEKQVFVVLSSFENLDLILKQVGQPEPIDTKAIVQQHNALLCDKIKNHREAFPMNG
jgi:hypothetical protein